MHASRAFFHAGLLIFFWTLSCVATNAKQPELVIYTENYSPLYQIDGNGNVTGIVAELLRKIAKRADISLDLRLRPFNRGLLAVKKSPGNCFLALWRTSLREPNFLWVGPLEIDGYAFFALKGSKISITSIEDSFKYPTGAVAGWTSTVEVQQAGHPELVLVDDDGLNPKMLRNGNTLLWLGGLLSAPYVAKEQGIEIENVFTVKEVDLSLACNPGTDRALIDRLQSALDRYYQRAEDTRVEQPPRRLTQ
ncbi:substrate-binding periplasmic protein [Roseibium sp.]|uniref:substrate-binding periplasmic protein n=1 Tax=Roseibium sp. TaxID=1936156 RepID=UPI003D0C309E